MFQRQRDSQLMPKVNRDPRSTIHTQAVEEQEENDVIFMVQLPDDADENRRINW